MKVGDIALKGDRLVMIAKLEYNEKKNFVRRGFRKVESGGTEKVLSKVWWKNIGEDLGLIHTEILSYDYNWDDMIFQAQVLKRQFDIIEQEKNKEDGTDNN